MSQPTCEGGMTHALVYFSMFLLNRFQFFFFSITIFYNNSDTGEHRSMTILNISSQILSPLWVSVENGVVLPDEKERPQKRR